MSSKLSSQTKEFASLSESSLDKPNTAIWWWSAIGLFAVSLQTWIFYQWWASGDMKHVPPGPTPIPQWMDILHLINSAVWAVAIVATFVIFIAKPYIKTGKLTFDAIFIMAFTSIWWQDALPNYNNLPFAYGITRFNLGSWSCHIPGWNSPGGCLLAEPLIWDFSFYFVLSALTTIFGAKLIHNIKAKKPHMRTSVAFMIFMAAVMVGDLIVELIWVWAGLYHYGGMPDHLSIFVDTRMKFPLFEPVLIGFLFGVWGSIYYFRNDKGETLVERGLDQVKAGAKTKQFMRFFALSGAINVSFFVMFSVPHILINLQSDAWPKAIQEVSHFTHGMCGAGTPYACGGEQIAQPREGAIGIGPDGTLTIPEGTKLPELIPLRTTPIEY